MTVLTEAQLGRAEECSRLGNLARKYGLRVGTANYECMVNDSALNTLRSTIKYAESSRGLNPNGDEVASVDGVDHRIQEIQMAMKLASVDGADHRI
jgi:hypothetical protein